LPQFPWPVPQATTRSPIPRALLARALAANERPGDVEDRLGDVASQIETALARAQLDYAVYAIGDSGFAYATAAEMIQQDGRPVPPPNRFPSDVRTAQNTDGILDFIISRFRARPGYFRIIAIVVTNRNLVNASATLTVDGATALVRGGMATMPPSLANVRVKGLQFVAYVYEFERANAADELVSLRTAPLVTARRHLAAAGIWTPPQLRP
jgi:hypothetical protein